MRKVEKKKGKVIEIQADVKINEGVILEKGDKIEVLDKKVEEKKLTEDHFLSQLGPEFSALLTDAYDQRGVAYVAKDLTELFGYFAMDWQGVDSEMYQLLTQLWSTAEQFS